MNRRIERLPRHVTRILLVKNLPYKITSEELYDIFGKFGAIYQIRQGNTEQTKGTAFVVYEDIFSAKSAVDKLSGFNVAGRYLVIMYFNPDRQLKKTDLHKKEQELQQLRERLSMEEGEV